MLSTVVDQICRTQGARVLAGLIRRFGDFDLAEDALQDAFTKALQVWPEHGLPDVPAAWLTTVAQRRALDLLRSRTNGHIYTDEALEMVSPDAEDGADHAIHPADQSGVEDDRLRLVFTCCHPALSRQAQTTLALRTLCGLSTREIAHAFFEPEATTAQRLVRTKRKILDARIPYLVPAREDLPQRLQTMLGVVYLVFNEGYAASAAPSLIRVDLSAEAIRLGRLLVELMPQEPEVLALLALTLLHDARRTTRTNADGQLVPLEEQDRSLWRRDLIGEGLALLDRALAKQRRGPYQLQAAIAALHANATRAQDTDWKQIAALYGGLLREQPSPVVELNAAVALAMAEGPQHGLNLIDQLAQREELRNYHLLHAARADLLRRLGQFTDARDAYNTALGLVHSDAERSYLLRRLGECGR